MQKSSLLKTIILTPIVALILATSAFTFMNYPASLASVTHLLDRSETVPVVAQTQSIEDRHKLELAELEERLRTEIRLLSLKKEESSIKIDTARHMLASTVQVTQGNSSGSGVVVYENKIDDLYYTYVLTNKHVVADATEVDITRFNYLRNATISSTVKYGGKVIKSIASIDLALIEIQTPESIGPTVSFVNPDLDSTLTLYQPVYIAGCPLTNPPLISNGNVGVISDTNNIVTAFSIFGSSGGGVYNRQGQLVGLVKGVSRISLNNNHLPESNLTHVIPAPLIKSWLITESLSFILNDGTHADFIASRKK